MDKRTQLWRENEMESWKRYQYSKLFDNNPNLSEIELKNRIKEIDDKAKSILKSGSQFLY